MVAAGGAHQLEPFETAAAPQQHINSLPGQQQQQQQQSNVLRRVAVLECEDSDRWKGYTESLWKAALWEEGDEWTIYQVCSGHLPTPSEAASFDAMLVSGSHYSAYEYHDWIKQLLQLLPQYVASGVRIYGCCFGSQILAQALGGSVGPNPDGNFVLTIEQVTPTQQLQQFKQLGPVIEAALEATAVVSSPPADAPKPARAAAAAAAGAAAATATATPGAGTDSSTSSNSSSVAAAAGVVEQLSDLSLSGDAGGSGASSGSIGGSNGFGSAQCSSGGCFQLIESHGDQVLTLPPGALVLATSATAPYELWCLGSNVLASQFHLEFDEPLVIDKIWTRLTSIGRLNSEQSADSRTALEAGGQHNVQMLQAVKHFLRHGIQ